MGVCVRSCYSAVRTSRQLAVHQADACRLLRDRSDGSDDIRTATTCSPADMPTYHATVESDARSSYLRMDAVDWMVAVVSSSRVVLCFLRAFPSNCTRMARYATHSYTSTSSIQNLGSGHPASRIRPPPDDHQASAGQAAVLVRVRYCTVTGTSRRGTSTSRVSCKKQGTGRGSRTSRPESIFALPNLVRYCIKYDQASISGRIRRVQSVAKLEVNPNRDRVSFSCLPAALPPSTCNFRYTARP